MYKKKIPLTCPAKLMQGLEGSRDKGAQGLAGVGTTTTMSRSEGHLAKLDSGCTSLLDTLPDLSLRVLTTIPLPSLLKNSTRPPSATIVSRYVSTKQSCCLPCTQRPSLSRLNPLRMSSEVPHSVSVCTSTRKSYMSSKPEILGVV